MSDTNGYSGQQDGSTGTHQYNALSFIIKQILSSKWTVTVAQVKSVTSSGAVATPGTVSVQPLVNQVDGQNNATPHGTISNVPYYRLQGGANAIICDPVVGDIGILLSATRDISSVIATKAVANPGSLRQMDASDSIFVGGLLGAVPTQYIQFNSDGITIAIPGIISLAFTSTGMTFSIMGTPVLVVNSTGIVVQGNIQATGGLLLGGTIQSHNGTGYAQNITTTGTVTASDATLAGKVFSTHEHADVQTGIDNTGPPV